MYVCMYNFFQCTVQLFQQNHVDKSRDHVENIGYSFKDGVLLLSRQTNGLKLYVSSLACLFICLFIYLFI